MPRRAPLRLPLRGLSSVNRLFIFSGVTQRDASLARKFARLFVPPPLHFAEVYVPENRAYSPLLRVHRATPFILLSIHGLAPRALGKRNARAFRRDARNVVIEVIFKMSEKFRQLTIHLSIEITYLWQLTGCLVKIQRISIQRDTLLFIGCLARAFNQRNQLVRLLTFAAPLLTIKKCTRKWIEVNILLSNRIFLFFLSLATRYASHRPQAGRRRVNR